MIPIVLAIVLVLISLYVIFQNRNKKIPVDYWDKKGIPTAKYNEIFKENECLSMAGRFVKIHNFFKEKGARHYGQIDQVVRHTYTAMDPVIIKSILVKDFDHFVNRGLDYDVVNNPLSGHIFNLEDELWRKWRIRLTPTFTTGKMRMMFPTIVKCADPMKKIFENYYKNQKPIDIKETLACYTTDVIGSCAFGIECNCLKNPNADFRIYGRNYITEVNKVQQTTPAYIKILPAFIQRTFSPQFKAIGEISRFFVDVFKSNVEYREKNNVHRNDFMHMLIQIKNRGELSEDNNLGTATSKNTIDIIEIAAQAFVFYIAGFETSSTLMTMACYEIATHEDIQDTLRQEISTVIKKHGGLTYDAVNEMTYLEKVLNETMRIHPPIPQLFRICTKDYKVPETDITVEKGTDVRIDVSAIHRDPEYYPNPDTLDPENFSKERIDSRPSFTFLPFGEGPRNCIGLRFGKLQAKIGLISLLKDFNITLNEKTEYPMKYNPWAFMVSINGELYLDLQKVN